MTTSFGSSVPRVSTGRTGHGPARRRAYSTTSKVNRPTRSTSLSTLSPGSK
jgi:hypothetical protein